MEIHPVLVSSYWVSWLLFSSRRFARITLYVLEPIIINSKVLKARPDLDIWSCSSKADDLERLPIRRCLCEVSFSSPFQRSLTLIAKGKDDCAPHSRRFGPSLSLPSIHNYSSYDAPHILRYGRLSELSSSSWSIRIQREALSRRHDWTARTFARYTEDSSPSCNRRTNKIAPRIFVICSMWHDWTPCPCCAC